MAINKLPKLYSTDFRLPNKKPVGDVEIDWNNPLSKGLVSGIYPFGGKAVNLARSNTGLNEESGVTNVIFGGQEVLLFDGTANARITQTQTFSDMSAYCDVYYNTLKDHAMFDVNNQDLTFWADNFSGELRTTMYAGSTMVGATGSLNIGEWNNWGGFADKSGNFGATYVNGIQNATGSIGTGNWENSSLQSFGGTLTSTAKASNAYYKYFLLWDRKLTAVEFKSISDNPYQILKPKSEPVYFTADAGGGGTITVPATLGTIAYASQNTTVSITGSIDVTATLGTISYASNSTTVDVSGSVDAIATLGTISYASNNTTVGVTGSVDVLTTLGTITYTSNDTTVSVSGAVDVTATLGTINYASNDVVVGVTGSVDVFATLGTINYTSNSPVVSIGGVVVVQATLGTISYASNDTVISLQGVVSVPATLGTISYASNDTVVSLAGLIDVNATLGTISYTSNNTTVTVAAGQTFGVVGVGFADDLYSSTFKPDSITVNFRG